MDNLGIIVVAVFTGVLLVFSVVGSVYVFRGHGVRNNVLQCENIAVCDRQFCRLVFKAPDEVESFIKTSLLPPPVTGVFIAQV